MTVIPEQEPEEDLVLEEDCLILGDEALEEIYLDREELIRELGREFSANEETDFPCLYRLPNRLPMSNGIDR